MICPHCHKPISRRVIGLMAKRAEEMKVKGYSIRQIQTKLNKDGFKVSVATVSRYFREFNKE